MTNKSKYRGFDKFLWFEVFKNAQKSLNKAKNNV